MHEDSADIAELPEDDLRALKWLAAHPDEAEEIHVARSVARLMQRLGTVEVAPPAGFETRLMQRINQDRTLLELLEAMLAAVGSAFMELVRLLLDLLHPSSQPAIAY